MLAKITKGLSKSNVGAPSLTPGGGGSKDSSYSSNKVGVDASNNNSNNPVPGASPGGGAVEKGEQRRRQEALQLVVEELGQARADSIAPTIRTALEVYSII